MRLPLAVMAHLLEPQGVGVFHRLTATGFSKTRMPGMRVSAFIALTTPLIFERSSIRYSIGTIAALVTSKSQSMRVEKPFAFGAAKGGGGVKIAGASRISSTR